MNFKLLVGLITVSILNTGCFLSDLTKELTGAEESNPEVVNNLVEEIESVEQTFNVTGSVNNNKDVNAPGNNLIVQLNGEFDIEVTLDGPFDLLAGAENGTAYDLAILQQPAGKSCEISNGSGVVDGNDIDNVTVDCTDLEFTVSVDVFGLLDYEGDPLVLRLDIVENRRPIEEIDLQGAFLNIDNNLVEAFINESFPFDGTLKHNESFEVSIQAQPTGHTCEVLGGFGTINEANIEGIEVSCSPDSFLVGGEVTGLIAGRSLVLRKLTEPPFVDGVSEEEFLIEDLLIDANGPYTFEDSVEFTTNFEVIVLNQPPGQNCDVDNANQEMGGADVNDVNVTCTPLNIQIGGIIDEIIEEKSVTLGLTFDSFSQASNSVVTTSVTQTFELNGTFKFAQLVPSGSEFTVSVVGQPEGQFCELVDNVQTPFVDTITNIQVNCDPIPFTLGGNVSNLLPGRVLSLQNGQGQPLIIESNGGFAFDDPVPFGSLFNVTVFEQPAGQICDVFGGSSKMPVGGFSGVSVTCTNLIFAATGSVEQGFEIPILTLKFGDFSEDQFQFERLTNASGILDPAEGGFTTPLPSGTDVSIFVEDQPAHTNCEVFDDEGSESPDGEVIDSDVEFFVDCEFLDIPASFNANGLPGTGQLKIFDNTTEQEFVFTQDGFDIQSFVYQLDTLPDFTVTETPANHSCLVFHSNPATVPEDGSGLEINVACSQNTFTIGGTVFGLAAEESFVIERQGAETLLIEQNGTYTFQTAVSPGTVANVVVFSQPPSQTCTILNGANVVVNSNITNIDIECLDNEEPVERITGGNTPPPGGFPPGNLPPECLEDPFLPQCLNQAPPNPDLPPECAQDPNLPQCTGGA